MDSSISAATLRIIIAVIGALILLAIYFFGRPGQQGQGRRILFRRGRDSRVEPVIGDTDKVIADPAEPGTEVPEPRQGELDVDLREELDRLGETVASARPRGRATPQRPLPGKRPVELPVERIVTLFVMARGEGRFSGSDVAVAAEKVGLEFGDMQIFHRPLDGKPEAGPIFSMANMVKPGTFDMSRIDEQRTPGLTFFMTLPGPLSALDAWDAMLPATQRMAELLGGNVMDEERNPLGRQRIAVLRDELRAWDRKHEGPEIQFNPRR
ncbi:MAG TPA: cell division protein ZipA [Rhodanobacteraceae bacterium]|nr:cell division protein ZipA [Rhodanobacteraceae bacterium]